MFTRWLMANSPMHKWTRRTVTVGLSIIMATSIVGCGLLPAEDKEEQLPTITPPKLSQKPVYEVTSDTLITRVRGIGELRSEQQEQLFFVDEGKRVKTVYVKAGDNVAEGQILAALDVADMERDLRQRKLRFRSNELAMIQTLRTADEMEPEALEQAKIDFELARTELVDLEEKIAGASIYASFSGTIVSVNIAKGDPVTAYKAVITMADLSKLVVSATISKEDLKNVAPGMAAVVTINAAGDFNGKVSHLPVPSTTTNEDPYAPKKETLDQFLLVDIDPFPEGVSLGTPLSVIVVTNKKENATVIPSAALRTYAGRNYVQVVDKDGTKREVDVEVGQQTSTLVEIIKGLSPGQKVVGK
ncbi:MAG: efflux RND transporter periplasmic adaptor subunit [Paenibacillaceae bacterium]